MRGVCLDFFKIYNTQMPKSARAGGLLHGVLRTQLLDRGEGLLLVGAVGPGMVRFIWCMI